VLLQRRLFHLSKTRWLIHALIFWPFVIRFLWGFIGLIGSLWGPGRETVWTLLDKNAPVTAFVFDLTGLVLMLGIVLAWIRGSSAKINRLPGLPRRDTPALALIGGIIGVGFVLEGMRIAMTGSPPGSEFAFLGQALSRLFAGRPWLTEAYGYVWYLHAVLTGIFIGYIPFSRLFHIITGPIVLAMNAADGHDEERGTRSPGRT
jgi:nitrate reductase gamma subunit